MSPAEHGRRTADLDLAEDAQRRADSAATGLHHPDLAAEDREFLEAQRKRCQAVADSLRERHARRAA